MIRRREEEGGGGGGGCGCVLCSACPVASARVTSHSQSVSTLPSAAEDHQPPSQLNTSSLLDSQSFLITIKLNGIQYLLVEIKFFQYSVVCGFF